MEIIVEILLNFIIEVVVEVILQILLSLGYGSVVDSFRERKKANIYLALFGCVLIGCVFGLLSYFIYPNRIIDNTFIPGISLFISPIVVGYVMKTWGKMRIESGKSISILATFWGGALFAFSYALVRFLLIN